MKALSILNKEWKEIARNKLILFNMILVPCIFIALPLVIAFIASDRPLAGQSLTPGEMLLPGQDASFQQAKTILLHQSLLMLLMIPIFLALGIAVYGIIGEKDQRSLEPLLSTPITVRELLLGKCLAVVVPVVWVTWITFGVLVLVLRLLFTPPLFAAVVRPMTLLTIVLLPPLLATLTVTAGLLISTLVDDIRVASQIGGIVVLPLVGLTILQIANRIAFDLSSFLLGIVGLAAADALAFLLLEKSFRRETILTRWR